MTSSSRTLEDITSLGKNRLTFALDPAPNDGIVSDPYSTDEVTVTTWQRHMLIPFKVDGTVMAFLGPYFKQHPTDIQICFPCLPNAMPPAFDREITLDFKYLSTKTRVFRSMPTPGNKEYLA